MWVTLLTSIRGCGSAAGSGCVSCQTGFSGCTGATGSVGWDGTDGAGAAGCGAGAASGRRVPHFMQNFWVSIWAGVPQLGQIFIRRLPLLGRVRPAAGDGPHRHKICLYGNIPAKGCQDWLTGSCVKTATCLQRFAGFSVALFPASVRNGKMEKAGSRLHRSVAGFLVRLRELESRTH